MKKRKKGTTSKELEYRRKSHMRLDGLTPRQTEFIRNFRKCGGDVSKTCKAMGITEVLAYRWLAMPAVKNEITQTLDYCRTALTAMVPVIITELREIMQSPETSASVKANIGLNLLDRAGLQEPKQPTVQVNINTTISDRAREILAKRLTERDSEIIDVSAVPSD